MSKMSRYKSYLTMSKMRGGGSRPLLDNVQKKDALFFDVFPYKSYTNIHDLAAAYWLILHHNRYFCLPLSSSITLQSYYTTYVLASAHSPTTQQSYSITYILSTAQSPILHHPSAWTLYKNTSVRVPLVRFLARGQGLLYKHLCHSLTQSLILCENIFMALPHPKGWISWS